MLTEHASDRRDYSFTETNSYAEAVKLMQTGYDQAAKLLKRTVKDQAKINSEKFMALEHPRPHNAIVGYIPNVPNAIRNIPQSMISVDRKPMKRKTLSIVYAETGNCCKKTEYFINAGAALLSAVELIERSGIQTQIDLVFMATLERDEFCFPTVRIKRYDERYSFQKVSFPLVHPSMFRRIGFKWLETTPDITESEFHNGYGHAPSYQQFMDNVKLPENCYFLDTETITENGCSVDYILKKLEVIK